MKAILIIGHGSKNEQSVKSFIKLFNRIKSGIDEEFLIEYSFLEYSKPDVCEVAEKLILKGVTQLFFIPVFLFEGVHIYEDIPDIIKAINKKYPDVVIRKSDVLGIDGKIIDLCIGNIDKSLAIGTQNNQKNLLVVGVGSSYPEANQNIALLTRILWEARNFNFASYAFVSRMTFPILDDELNRLIKHIKGDLIVIPVMLFPGVYLKDIQCAISKIEDKIEGAIIQSDVFKDSEYIVDAILRRINEITGNTTGAVSSETPEYSSLADIKPII